MTLSVVSFEMKTKTIQLTVSTLAVSFRSVRAKQEVQVQHVRVVTHWRLGVAVHWQSI